jgi:hypothetical protein
MWTKVGVGLYCVAALWLAAFVAYLVYLLLPFGVGLLSSSFAALVAVVLLISLIRRLIVGPLKGEPVGRWRFILVSAVAVATLTLDAGWTHYRIPFPPTDQDECTFGPIGPDEFRALRSKMAEKLDPDWLAIARVPGAEEEFEQHMAALLPKEASNEEMVAHMHAMARALGAQFDSGGVFEQARSDRDDLSAWYFYKFDINTTMAMRAVVFRWGRVAFRIVKRQTGGETVELGNSYVLIPGLKDADQYPPRDRSCPSLTNRQLISEQGHASHLP